MMQLIGWEYNYRILFSCLLLEHSASDVEQYIHYTAFQIPSNSFISHQVINAWVIAIVMLLHFLTYHVGNTLCYSQNLYTIHICISDCIPSFNVLSLNILFILCSSFLDLYCPRPTHFHYLFNSFLT